ncbi:RNA polymerase sigma factor [Sphingobacterium sp. BN32]|uniref:RNA polymerase sigma factor n=1 Tax=Sphingobacterium sp. BN32 TaxID=3058432 RepID=UPI00265C9AD1|nr:RNA polymerase sigma-70 factor [Sphingobacterium sp. BN32]WKK59251.1 RNA polymerase sigma-70 factor [Sphingobacterium sp. BN32]
MTLPNELNLLFREFQNGNEAAFSRIYDQYYIPLSIYALKYVSEVDAQDVLADLFISLWQRRCDFGNLDDVKSYLYVSVKNRCINVLKRTSVRTEHQSKLLIELETLQSSQNEMELMHAELINQIWLEIESLPPKMREVFLLTYRDGIKPASIAQRLQLSVQTVRNQKHSALQRLRAIFGDSILSYILLLLNSPSFFVSSITKN